jgi:hypothetical protein
MTLSVEKTHITHIDDGFVFLGFRIQRRRRGGDRRVVLTVPSKQELAGVIHKIKQATKTRHLTHSGAGCCGRSTRYCGVGRVLSATARPSRPSPTWAGMPGGG